MILSTEGLGVARVVLDKLGVVLVITTGLGTTGVGRGRAVGPFLVGTGAGAGTGEGSSGSTLSSSRGTFITGSGLVTNW